MGKRIKENEEVSEVVTEASSADTEPKTFWSKTASFGKKVLSGMQSSAQSLAEQTKKNAREKQLKKYNPLTAEKFRSEEFTLPNVIEIVDDAVRRDIEVCEGAIGWTDFVNDVEVLHLYDEWVAESGLQFIPFPKCDAVYCVDNFERTKFINAETVFERSASEKIAELENIAYCLGAKSCSIEIVEHNSQTTSSAAQITANAVSNQPTAGLSLFSQNQNRQSGKNVSLFEGNRTPSEPPLKWFSFDENIKGLIAMRCSGNNSIKSKLLEISCTTSSTMSQKAAGAIDKILKVNASMSMEKKAIKEHCSVLVFEVNF